MSRWEGKRLCLCMGGGCKGPAAGKEDINGFLAASQLHLLKVCSAYQLPKPIFDFSRESGLYGLHLCGFVGQRRM